MNARVGWKVIVTGLLLTIVILQLMTMWRFSVNMECGGVHTLVLKWDRTEIPARNVTSGYVAYWKAPANMAIVAVQVWMGNPSGIFWEGDVYVTLNNQGDFQSPDQVIVHYQLDKHAESSVPHQLWFQIGSCGSAFNVSAGQTIWIWRAFNNISNETVMSGDGQVIIYYEAE